MPALMRFTRNADEPQQALNTSILRREAQDGCCFPFRLRCCPCLPTSWSKVQDWLHLVLLLGVLGSVMCVVQMVWEVALEGRCKSAMCWKEVISGVLVVPSTVYFIKTIGQYDMELQEKKERHREAVDNLLQELNRQKEELRDVARKMAERANTWALGRFADKRRYFESWLERIRSDDELYLEEEMVEELRKFVISWLNVFSGCLLRPESSPLLQSLGDELARCHTAREVCNVALRRLKDSKVEFQFATDAQSYTIQPRGSQVAIADVGNSCASYTSFRSSGSAEEAGQSVRMVVNPEGKCGVTWLRCRRRCGCARRGSNTEDRMPVTYTMLCLSVKIMSRQHANLLFAFWMDIGLVVFEVLSRRWASVALVAINEVCVTSILACFEQLNDIAILERQIETFERHNNEVRQKHEKAMDDWSKVEQLHDLWEYRTMPSLAFHEKVHLRLENKDQEVKRGMLGLDSRLEWFRYANAQLNVLDLKFGRMEDWRGSQPLDDEWKVKIGKELKARAEGDRDIDQLLKVMPFMLKKDLNLLEDQVPDIGEVRPTSSLRSTPEGSPRTGNASASSSFASVGGEVAGTSSDPPQRAGKGLFSKKRQSR